MAAAGCHGPAPFGRVSWEMLLPRWVIFSLPRRHKGSEGAPEEPIRTSAERQHRTSPTTASEPAQIGISGLIHGEDVSMTEDAYELHPIGWVESSLVDPDAAPKQGDEGAPDADLMFNSDVAEGIKDLHVGEELIVLTWLHRARRDVLAVRPRDDDRNPLHGVFGTRSADRPNPVGLHRVVIVSIDGLRVRVRNLEALDGTPVIDVKPILGPVGER